MWYYFLEAFADGVRALITFILDYWALIMLALIIIVAFGSLIYQDTHHVHHI
jgi:hypothetical protein